MFSFFRSPPIIQPRFVRPSGRGRNEIVSEVDPEGQCRPTRQTRDDQERETFSNDETKRRKRISRRRKKSSAQSRGWSVDTFFKGQNGSKRNLGNEGSNLGRQGVRCHLRRVAKQFGIRPVEGNQKAADKDQEKKSPSWSSRLNFILKRISPIF